MKNRDIISALRGQYRAEAPDIWHKVSRAPIPEATTKTRRVSRPVMRLAAGFAALAIVIGALWGTNVWHGNQPPVEQSTTPPAVTLNTQTQKTNIVINEMPSATSDRKLNINLAADDFIPMSRQELCDFYGINVFPSVIPDDMTEDAAIEKDGAQYDAPYGIYKRSDGEVYWSQNVINYYNKDCTRNINIEVAKGQLPMLDYGSGDEAKKSVINGTEVLLGHYSCAFADGSRIDHYYNASFMYKNVGFQINATNLTKNEFIDMVSSVLGETRHTFTITQYASGSEARSVTVRKGGKSVLKNTDWVSGSYSAGDRINEKTGKKEYVCNSGMDFMLSGNVKEIKQTGNPAGTVTLYKYLRQKDGSLRADLPGGGYVGIGDGKDNPEPGENWIYVVIETVIPAEEVNGDEPPNAREHMAKLVTLNIRVTFDDGSAEDYTMNFRPTEDEFLKAIGEAKYIPVYDMEIL